MKNKFCLLIVSFLCISSLLPAGAQTLSEKDFQVLNMNDGLSDNDIHSVAKDTEGFMWFGTEDGLNRFDGYEFMHVTQDPGDVNSLSNDTITAIFEDRIELVELVSNGNGGWIERPASIALDDE